MEITVKKLTSKDMEAFIALLGVFEQVFAWEHFCLPSQLHLQNLLKQPSFLVFVAQTDKQVIGGLTAYVLAQYDSEKPAAYVYDLAVVGEHQRKGIGKKILSALNEYCQQNGFKEVFVQAESDDLQAVNFYRSTPISGHLQATHFYYSFHNQ